MKNILWYQDPENLSNDVISFNGEILTPPSNPKYREKYKLLSDIIGTQVNGNKNIYKLLDGYFVKGYFNEMDNKGRNTPFDFYSDTLDKQEFIDRLKDEARINGKSCPDLLIDDIKNFKQNKISLSKVILVSAIIIAIIAIIIVKNL